VARTNFAESASRARPWLCVTLTVAALLPAATAAAQTENPIVTDRPTQSAATFVISPGVFQIEGGYRFTRAEGDSDAATDAHLFPDALFRFGVVDWAEARLTVGGLGVTSATGTENSSGFNDIGLGAKFAVADEAGARPAISILVDVTVPVGSDELTGDFVSPKLLALLSRTLSDRWALTVNLGPAILRDHEETGVDLEYAAAIGAVMSSHFTLFAEFYGALPLSDVRVHRHSFQTGVTALLGSDVQLDARVGLGFVDDVPDWLAGFGVSWRLFSD